MNSSFEESEIQSRTIKISVQLVSDDSIEVLMFGGVSYLQQYFHQCERLTVSALLATEISFELINVFALN